MTRLIFNQIMIVDKQGVLIGITSQEPIYVEIYFSLRVNTTLEIYLILGFFYRLTYFMSLFCLYTPCKYQKTRGFLFFLGGLGRDR